jgi:hypothetical protein
VTEPRKPFRVRAARWMGEHVAGAIVGTLVSLALGAGVAWLFTRADSVAERVDEVRAGLQADGFEVEYRELELHQGDPSHLFVASKPAENVSDEVRIYDVVDGSLELELDYRPEVVFTDSSDEPVGTAFESRAVVDIDGDGQSEILGSYEANLAGAEYQRVPVLVARGSAGGYEVTPLIAAASFDRDVTADLPTVDFGPTDGEQAKTVWVSDFALDDENVFSPVRATLVTRVVAEASPGSTLALSIEPRDGALPLTVRFWALEMLGGTPRVTPNCILGLEDIDAAQPLAVSAGAEETEALFGKKLFDAMSASDLALGTYLDGGCGDPPL